MEIKTVVCIDCGAEVTVSRYNSRTNRCDPCRKQFYDNYQKEYQKTYFKKHRRKFYYEEGERERVYKKRNTSLDFQNYCKNNRDTITGCLNCICDECIQEIDNDTYLPWDETNTKFFEERISYVPERYIK